MPSPREGPRDRLIQQRKGRATHFSLRDQSTLAQLHVSVYRQYTRAKEARAQAYTTPCTDAAANAPRPCMKDDSSSPAGHPRLALSRRKVETCSLRRFALSLRAYAKTSGLYVAQFAHRLLPRYAALHIYSMYAESSERIYSARGRAAYDITGAMQLASAGERCSVSRGAPVREPTTVGGALRAECSVHGRRWQIDNARQESALPSCAYRASI